MSIKQVRICDRCQSEVGDKNTPIASAQFIPNTTTGLFGHSYAAKTFELCESCEKQFAAWIKCEEEEVWSEVEIEDKVLPRACADCHHTLDYHPQPGAPALSFCRGDNDNCSCTRFV
jgi:hypothetical protein